MGIVIKKILVYKMHILIPLLLLLVVLFLVINNGFREKAHKRLIIGSKSEAISLDPAIATDTESFQVTSGIYETLVKMDANGMDILPGLAESWKVSEDGLTFVFKLRKEVYFHDKELLDAEAVVFNFDRWKDVDSPYHIGQFTYWNQSFGGNPVLVKSVLALSKDTVEIVLNEPFTPFLSVLSMPPFGIASPIAIIKYNENLKNHPIGTGPFQMASWEKENEIVLTRNEAYWDGKVAVNEVVFRTINEGDDYIQMLESGELHIMNQIVAADVEQIKGIENVYVEYLPFLNIGYLALNHTKEPLNRLEVRQAISMCIDKKQIIQEAFDSLSKQAFSFLPPTFLGYQEDFGGDEDIEQAKELLEKAGYADGFDIELWVMEQPRSYYTNPYAVAEYIAEQLAVININVTIKTISMDQYIVALKEGKHEMAIIGWQADYSDPDNFLYTLFYSANTEEGTVLNYAFYSNDYVDQLLRQARRVADNAFRASIYGEIQEILYEDMVSIPLAHTMTAIGINDQVIGFKANISGQINFDDIDMFIYSEKE